MRAIETPLSPVQGAFQQPDNGLRATAADILRHVGRIGFRRESTGYRRQITTEGPAFRRKPSARWDDLGTPSPHKGSICYEKSLDRFSLCYTASLLGCIRSVKGAESPNRRADSYGSHRWMFVLVHDDLADGGYPQRSGWTWRLRDSETFGFLRIASVRL